ncbi:MAG: hypothetical protein M9962_06825 [Oligoflexia bacterium]|nr:hypothetical protein [Oligoflexia bacterium]
MSSHFCYNCQSELEETNFGRRDECPKCMRDTRVCKNCKNYDKTRNNECLEEQAPRQVEKEKANFCDWFQAKVGKQDINKNSQDLKSIAENLFKKK